MNATVQCFGENRMDMEWCVGWFVAGLTNSCYDWKAGSYKDITKHRSHTLSRVYFQP